MKDKITKQQRLFIKEYIANKMKNATESAIKAGYSPKTATSQASQLLKNPRVVEELQKEQKKLYDDLKNEFLFDVIKAKQVMTNILDDPTALDKDRITVAKHFFDVLGLTTQKVEISGVNGEAITVKNEVDLQKLSDEELDQLEKIISKSSESETN